MIEIIEYKKSWKTWNNLKILKFAHESNLNDSIRIP